MKKFLAGVYTVICFAVMACTTQPERMILPNELEVVNLQSEGDSICMACKYQVVVFHDFDRQNFFPYKKQFLWSELKDRFPEVGFIFYCSGQDKQKLARELADLEFPFPVYHDPQFLFYGLNRLDSIQSTYDVLHSFHLKDGFPVKRAQIGMAEYFLKEIEGILKKE